MSAKEDKKSKEKNPFGKKPSVNPKPKSYPYSTHRALANPKPNLANTPAIKNPSAAKSATENQIPCILVQPKDMNEYRLFTEMFERMGTDPHSISSDEMEDIGFTEILKASETNERVSEDDIMRSLNA